ncbi:MAG: universal stress protein [Pseudomonadota bacterium]
MQIKSILCAYSGDTAQGSGLRHAMRLAKHHDAHITGALRHGRSTLEERYAARLPEALLETLAAADTSHIAEVAKRFEDAAAAEGLSDRAEFVELDPSSDGTLAAFAHAFDIIVSGVHSDAANEAHLAAHPDMLALRSGRPVLVVPNSYDANELADRAIIAWDGKRSAARALGDAIGILAEKSHVTLLSVGDTPRGIDRVTTNMARHGIKVDARTLERRGSIADTILREAEHDGAKLLVMGAFEHSKFAHDMFGGVTTDVIAHSSVPVFMAH